MIITLVIDTAKDKLEDVARSLLRMSGTETQEITVKIDGTDMVADLKKTLNDFQAGTTDAEFTDVQVAPPPPPPATMSVDTGTGTDAEIEVETDDTGTMVSMTTGVTLSAPPPPVPVPPGPIVAAELDKRGLPWDGRIHASNRAKTIKEEWKYKRGVDKNLIVAVEATYSPLVSAPSAPTQTGATAPIPPAPIASMAAAVAPPPPPPPPPPAPTAGIAAPAAGAPSTVTDFRSLMQKITTSIQAKKLTDEQVNAALGSVGLGPQDMTQLIGNNPLIQSVNSAIDAVLAA